MLKKLKTNKLSDKKYVIIARVIGMVWAVLLYAIVISCFSAFLDNYYMPNPAYTIDGIKRGEVIGIYGKVYGYYSYGIEDRSEFDELVAISDYIGDITQYKMFKENNETEKAAYYHNKMTEDRKDFGRLDFVADELNEKYEIE